MIKVNNYSVFLPNYTIGEAAYQEIPNICTKYGNKIVIIGGKQALQVSEIKIKESIKGTNLNVIDTIWYGGEATFENVERLRSITSVHEADMIFAVGGGKALDTCKCLADKIQKTIFTFPTIASTCAACTTVSIMYREDGSFLQPYFFLESPTHAFIDTDIIANAPVEYMWAGIGDTYAKYYECTVSSRGEQLEHFNALGIEMSYMCVRPLFEFGKQALEDNRNGHSSYELQQVVLGIIVTTAEVSIDRKSVV